jgi:uncharacterized protein YbaR (Trm112 family)
MANNADAHHTDPFLLELLVCPISGSTLIFSKDKKELISKPAKRGFPIRDGIPILVESETRVIPEEELKKI